MKPIRASRPTACYYCHEEISPGERRLDETLRIGTYPDKKPMYRRVHWHFACFDQYCQEYYEEHQELPRIERRGRPRTLALTPAEQGLRHKALVNNKALVKYYTFTLANIIQTPIDALTHKDLKTLNTFLDKYLNNLDILLKTGGIPKTQEPYDISLLVSCRAQLSYRLNGPKAKVEVSY